MKSYNLNHCCFCSITGGCVHNHLLPSCFVLSINCVTRSSVFLCCYDYSFC